jgi:hypothetical protein
MQSFASINPKDNPMKNLKLFLGQLVLLCVASCAGGGNFAFAQSLPPNYVQVATEFQTIDIPAGVTLTVEYGCSGAWSAPVILTGPNLGMAVQPSSIKGSVDSAVCPKNALIVLQSTAAVDVVVHSPSYNSAGVETDTAAKFTITALPVVTSPPVTTTTTTPPPATTTSTTPTPAVQPVCQGSASLTAAKDGTVTVIVPPYCLLMQPKGAWGFVSIGGYNITITGDQTSPLFAPGNGTNMPLQ